MAKEVGVELTATTDKLERKINNLIKKVGNLQGSLTSLSEAFKNNKGELAEKDLEKLTSIIGKLNKEIQAVNKSASVNQVKKFTKELKEAGEGITGDGGVFDKFTKANEAATNKGNGLLGFLTQVGKKGSIAGGALTAAFGEPVSMAIGAVVQGIKNIINTIVQLIEKVVQLAKKWYELSQKQSQYIEDLNFLNNAYKDANNSGKELLDTLEKTVGYDPAKLTQSLATFRQFGNALEYDADVADTLAENMLKMSVDVKSLTGQDLETVTKKFQSALAGNIRAVRAYGVDITQAALQQEALNLGIDEEVTNMSRAEKTLLTYIVMQKQLSTANGDLAKTVNSVGNQTEILHNQFDMLGRNVGAFLIPVLQRLLPVLNGILMVINTVMSAIQGIFGISAEGYAAEQGGTGYSDALDELYDSLESEGKAAAKANKSSKDLQKTLRGFDKLNVIKTPTKSGTSGSGGAGGTGINKKLIDAFKKIGEYDLHLDEMINKAAQFRDKILELIHWEDIKKWIGIIKTEIDLLVEDMKKSGLWDLIQLIIKGIVGGAFDAVGKIIVGAIVLIGSKIRILRTFVQIWGKIHDALQTVRKVIMFVGYATRRIWEEYIKPFIVDNYNKYVKPVIEEAKKYLKQVKDQIEKDLAPVIKDIKEKFNDFKNAIKGVVDWLRDHLFPETEEGERKLGKLKDALSPLSDIVDTLQKALHNLKVALEDIKKGNFDRAFNGLKSTFDKTLGKMATAVGTLVDNLQKLGNKNITSKAGSALQSMFNTANIGSGASDIIKTIIKKADGGIWNNGIWSPVKAYAGGGFPSRGELFMARETKGPELVGKIGSSTAVLNNDQILEQMAIAVARGIAASGNNDKQVNIIAKGDTKGLLDFIEFEQVSKNRQYGL